MSSTAPRRASYQLNAQQRSRVQSVLVDHAAKLEREQDEQQQPSPQAAKPIKHVDINGDNNNQDEEPSAGDSACASVSETRQDDSGQPASSFVSTPKVEKTQRQLQAQHSLKQEAVDYDPPLTTARLREENATLKFQLLQQQNQHESEMLALKSQLTDAASAHQHVEKRLKKQIEELEKRQHEAAENAHKYQEHVESLQRMLQALENQTKGSAATPRTSLKPPRPVVTPLPYSGVKPFAWRQDGTSSHTAAPVPFRALCARHLPSGESAHVTPQPTRCIPVPAATTQLPRYDLPPPISVAKDQQQRHAVLTAKPSGGLLSYCADVISYKLVTQSPKPNMKVTPMWSVDWDDEDEEISRPEASYVHVPAPQSETLPASAEDYTAITIL